MEYCIEIAEYPSIGIRVEARKLGITHMREVARAGEGDHRVILFALPLKEGGEIRALDTNGDPLWEEEDPAAFAEGLEEAGIDA